MVEKESGENRVLVIDDDDVLVISVKQKLQSIDGVYRHYETCSIHRVIPYVQVVESGSYHPKLISTGPFHRGKSALLVMENLKLRYLQDLLRRCQEKKTMERFVAVARKLEARARLQYSEEVSLDSNAFVEMMVLDGCFIIEFLLKWYSDEIYGHLCVAYWSLPLLRSDLLLLENQLPFFVVETLYSIVQAGGQDRPETFMHLALAYLTRRTRESLPVVQPKVKPYHLLHLLHMSLNPEMEQKTESSSSTFLQKMVQKMTHIFSLRSLSPCKNPTQSQSTLRRRRPQQLVPSAVELQEAGVTFKKEEKEHCFLSVEFVEGKLVIPSLTINSISVSLLLNLLALEQSCTDTGNYVTCYAAFMDSIVNTSADVAVLQSCMIIKNQLGNEENVADFFNRLGGGVPRAWTGNENYLAGVMKKVNEYSKQPRHKYFATLWGKYFVNPWTIISVVAGSVLLLLTALQTVFTIYSPLS